MSRINTSRQTVSAKQRNCNYHPSGMIASHVLATTVERDSSEPVIEEDGMFLVASKFEGRYYRVWQEGETWQCSSREERVVARCLAQAQAYRMEHVAA